MREFQYWITVFQKLAKMPLIFWYKRDHTNYIFSSSTKTMEYLIFTLSLRLEFKKLGLFDKCLEVLILFFLALHFLILNPLLFLHPWRTPALHLKLRRWIPFNWAQHRAGCLHEGSVPSLTQIAVSSYQIKLLDKWNWFLLSFS